jgi:hypothetical protein
MTGADFDGLQNGAQRILSGQTSQLNAGTDFGPGFFRGSMRISRRFRAALPHPADESEIDRFSSIQK